MKHLTELWLELRDENGIQCFHLFVSFFITSFVALVLLTLSKPSPVLLGDHITLICCFNGSQDSSYIYSWSHNDSILPDLVTSTLTLPGVKMKDLGQYQCMVKNVTSAILELYTAGKVCACIVSVCVFNCL